ncbi:hypothetical protein QQ91_0012660, partial (plasmid) [Lyngbya confervoides BDU141951]|nr:hypothetical protein [Lyngbya confervoides BDU141951]
ATGNNGNKVILWDLQGNQITVMDGHQFAVKDLKFNSKSTYLSTTSSEGVVRLWDLREISESTEGHQGPITPTVFSPNENFIVSTGIGDKQIFSWEIQNGRLKPVKRPSPKLPENDILHINEVFFHDD